MYFNHTKELNEYYELGKKHGKVINLLIGAILGFAFAFAIYLLVNVIL